MTVSATGNFGKAAAALKDLISASSTFQGEKTELVTNGGFATNLDGWSVEAGWVWSASGFGRAEIADAGTNVLLYQSGIFSTGKTFVVSFSVKAVAGASLDVLSNLETIASGITAADDYEYTYAPGANSDDHIIFSYTGSAGNSLAIDDVSIKEMVIFIGEYNPGGSSLSDCFAVIQRSSDVSTSVANTHYSNNGELNIVLERAIPAAYQDAGSESDAEQDFFNFLDGVINDCQTLSGTAGYLMTRAWTVTETARIDNENRYFAKITVAWGLATS